MCTVTKVLDEKIPEAMQKFRESGVRYYWYLPKEGYMAWPGHISPDKEQVESFFRFKDMAWRWNEDEDSLNLWGVPFVDAKPA